MMALRHRLTLLAAATVGVTVVLVSVVAYFVLRNELRNQVDEALAAQYEQVQRLTREFGPSRALGLRLPAPSARRGGPNGPVQLLTADGSIVFRDPDSDVVVPVDESDRAVAGGSRQAALRDVHSADGVHLRDPARAQPRGRRPDARPAATRARPALRGQQLSLIHI